MKHIFIYLFLVLLGSSLCTKAQNNTNSPYSKFGLGDFDSQGFGRNAALGNAGIALQSNVSLNNMNPASYTGLDSLSVLMEMGVHSSYTQLKTASDVDDRWNANFSYLALGFKARSKWAMSFGLAPYSNVGYNILTTSQIDGSLTNYETSYDGIGGLTSVYWGNAFQVTKSTAIGINSSFLFGPKTENQYIAFTGSENYEILRQVTNKYHGWKFDLGLQQNFQISPDHQFTFGVVINAPGILRNSKTTLVTETFISAGAVDTLQFDEEVSSDLTFPVNLGVGLTYYYHKKVLLTADYRLDRWSQVKIEDKFSNLVDNQQFSLGCEYAPDGFSGRFAYRAGFNYESGYFDIDGKKLTDYSITAGVVLPLPTTRVNIYASYGWRGTTKANLISENYARLGINLTLMDKWFQKRKFR